MEFAIETFSTFHGQVFLAGWIGESAVVTLDFDDGHSVPVPLVPADGVFRFDLTTPGHFRAALTINGVSHRNIAELGIGNDPAHALYRRFWDSLSPQGAMLEIGSRARSAISRKGMTPQGWSYTGIDVVAGENVDVVGDAHKLSSLFEQRFDAVFAISVLEHILMPWKLAIELNRVMNPGAIGFFLTHQSWPVHDEPWDFWRFSDQSWRSILNPATGFEILEAQMGEPMFTVPRWVHAATNFEKQHAYGASAVLFRKVSETTLEWPVEVEDVTATNYPSTTGVFVA